MQARIPMPGCASPWQRKQSHDDEKSRFYRIDNDTGCDLRTCICGRGRIVHSGLARCDRPLGPAIATRLQCLLSGDANCRDPRAPLSWRTEVERLTSLPCRQTDIPRQACWRALLPAPTRPRQARKPRTRRRVSWIHGGPIGRHLSEPGIR
jgi:hypothetical protein